MTNNEIIEMACQAGFEKIPMTSDDWVCFTEELLSFAKLVAEKEREECAKICDGNIDSEYKTGKVDHNEIAWAQLCAIQIRKRGQE